MNKSEPGDTRPPSSSSQEGILHYMQKPALTVITAIAVSGLLWIGSSAIETAKIEAGVAERLRHADELRKSADAERMRLMQTNERLSNKLQELETRLTVHAASCPARP